MVMTPILQFGTSRFLQAHFDLFVSESMQGGTALGPICVVQSSGNAERARRLQALADPAGYCVRVRGISNGEIINTETQVTSIVRSLSTTRDWPEITRIASDEVKIIVSNTGDTGFQPTTFDDAATFELKMSYPAKLMHLLLARHRAGAAPVQIMPMELIANNGSVLRDRVMLLAARRDDGFQRYLQDKVLWVNSLVDRIVSEALEPAGAIAEPYALWAIEDQPGLLPPCIHPCITLVDDLVGIESLKLYILNLGHTFLAQQWMQAGDSRPAFVRNFVSDPHYRELLTSLYRDEVIPGFRAAGMAEAAEEYVAVTLERFDNPFLDHQLFDIATNHQDKVQRRLAAFTQWASEHGDSTPKPRLEAIINNPCTG